MRDPDAYWRRRFFILVAVVAVIGVCACLLPGGRPTPARTSAAAQASMVALDRRGELPEAAYGSPWPAPTPEKTATAGAVPVASATSVGQPSAATNGDPHASPSPTPSASTSAVTGPPCAPSNIVISLFTGQASYGQGAAPTFDVYAVSTSSAPCTFSYGPGSVQVVVTSRGRAVWESAACKPPAAPSVLFTLGVPQLLSITWDRKAAEPSGCAGTLPAGASGTFDAVATTDGRSSAVRSFTLSR